MLWLLACAPFHDADIPAPNLTDSLGSDEVRAGVVEDATALFGGVSAEGRLGDIKLYNSRVRFILQQAGDSGYYAEYGGGIIDADIVRPDGQPGRDMLDEHLVMVGLGRLAEAETVTVVSDGQDGVARVRVEGHGAPFQLLTGAVESPSLVPDIDLRIVTEYVLRPDSSALEITTTVENRSGAEQILSIGDVALVAMDVASAFRPVSGFSEDVADAPPWVGIIADRNEGALALLGADGPLSQGAVGDILSAVAPAISGFSENLTIADGGTASWVRYLGAGPDLATLSAAQEGWWPQGYEEIGGLVLSGGARVAGARVTVLNADGAPVTQAITDADGAWSALAPPGWQVVASGRGPGWHMDLPAGHGWYGAYDAQPELALASLSQGATPIPLADGYGVGAPTTDRTLALVPPGTLSVTIADGGPAVVTVLDLDGDVAVDERYVLGRPSGYAAVAYVRDGAMDVPLEPGRYRVVGYRGVRDELDVAEIEVVSGEAAALTLTINPAYTLEGVVTGDPHSHASPSGDGGLPMEERLLVTAANGIDLHFGTDHDHIVDYRPLIEPLGLSDRLMSVVADEVSPVLRGHFNAWPVAVGSGANGGAPRWWFGYTDTAEVFSWMRELVGQDGVIQANHPVGGSGMFSFAGYDPSTGTISSPEHWSDDFNAMEVLNSGEWEEYFPWYVDLATRGYPVAPVGVSDSHTEMGGEVGISLTFFLTDTDLAGVTEDVLRATMARQATVVSRGPYIDARVDGAAAPGATVVGPADLDVTVMAPSWLPVEEVALIENGVEIEVLPCTGVAPTPCDTTFTLAPAQDAVYIVLARSATPATDAHPGQTAWAATAALRVDATGDGFVAPWPALVTQ